MDDETKERFEKIEKRLELIEGRNPKKIEKKNIQQEWYKKGSTIHKILILNEEKFFDEPKTISEIIKELKSKDYHLKASDLTLPLRKVVRKNILKKTKLNKDKSESKNWMYTK